MADHKPLTPDQQRRLEKAPYLSLVAYFHPRPPKAGKLFSQLVSLTADAVGDLRVSGHAIRNIPFDAERHGRLLRREYHRIYLHKLPKTLRRIARDSVVRGLNAGSFGSVWVNQMSPHRPTGLKELVWYLAYDENPRQFATDLDPYVHLFITIDRMSWRGMGLRQFITSFFEICAATGVSYGGIADPTRWGESMGRCYHDFCAGTVPLNRLLDNFNWVRSRQRRKYVRGVYWGTMLPSRVVRRLGGLTKVRKRWVSAENDSNRSRAYSLPNGAVFLTITDAPVNQPSAWDLAPAEHLHRALRENGLLL